MESRSSKKQLMLFALIVMLVTYSHQQSIAQCKLYQNSTQCLLCNSPYVLSSDKTNCNSCTAACTSCVNLVCKSCDAGYYLTSSSTCAFCDPQGNGLYTNCNACNTAGKCSSCIDGFFLNSSTLSCNSCPNYCNSCTNSTYCNTCTGSYQLTTTNSTTRVCTIVASSANLFKGWYLAVFITFIVLTFLFLVCAIYCCFVSFKPAAPPATTKTVPYQPLGAQNVGPAFAPQGQPGTTYVPPPQPQPAKNRP